MTHDNENIKSDFWIGIVEDNSNDPLKLGQCRVRIIGTHSFDATELPTERLPWAIPTIPLNGSKTVSVPNLNDWVFGYFMDGQSKQMPVILGTMPGLLNYTTYVKMTGTQQQEYQKKLDAQAKPLPKLEKAPQQGQPTTPPIARGDVENSPHNVLNDMRAHACDISLYINHDVASAKSEVRKLIVGIRKEILAALKALGISPGTSALKGFLDDVKRTLKSINKFLTKIVDNINLLVEAIRKIRAVIEYILSLPAQAAQYFQDCLNRLYAVLSKSVFGIISGGYDEAVAETPISITNEASSILEETKTLLNNAVKIYSGSYQVAAAIVSDSGKNFTEDDVKKIFEESYSGHKTYKVEDFRPVAQ